MLTYMWIDSLMVVSYFDLAWFLKFNEVMFSCSLVEPCFGRVWSAMKAEFVSCLKVTSHGLWLKSFISELRIMDSISRPLKIFCDNSAMTFMDKNNKSSSQSKHIDIKYWTKRECIKENKVVIEYICTKLMIVDPLTKGMPPMKFKDHMAQMGLSFILWIWCSIYIICNEI